MLSVNQMLAAALLTIPITYSMSPLYYLIVLLIYLVSNMHDNHSTCLLAEVLGFNKGAALNFKPLAANPKT
jgi:hypothetical protein